MKTNRRHRHPLPEALQNFVRQAQATQCYSTQQILDYIINRWRRWRQGDKSAAIPGYPSPPPPNRSGLPRGFTYKTFWRLGQPVTDNDKIKA